jgi:hypothetical protein
VRRATTVLAVAVAVLAAREARPCGPGVHANETWRALELLAATDAQYAEDMKLPLARSYIALGANAPDLQWWIDPIDFGHENALSYGLVDAAAAKGPEYRLMAFGHLAHVTASDPGCEQFWAPALVASAPVGMVDLFKGDQGPEGATSGLLSELYGDFILGDWLAIVDVLFDFHLDGAEADARLDAAVTWYCETANAVLSKSADCGAAVAKLLELFGAADTFLGNMSRQDAKELIATMTGQSLPDLADFFASGSLNALLGMSTDKSEHFDSELARFKSGPLVDPDYWAQYDLMMDNGPRWALARLAERNDGWPSWVGTAIVGANVQSVMRFLPGEYAPVFGLLVDGVWWRDEDGNDVAKVTATMAGKKLRAHVRFYSAVKRETTLRGVVRKDGPGAANAADAIVGESAYAFSTDPYGYVTTPRLEMDVPFTVDLAGARGFYLDLLELGADKPAFTTSWDRLWRIPDLPLDHAVYRDNFGTYGHWPSSLPIENPAVDDATLLVVVRSAPDGPGIGGATATLAGGGDPLTPGPSGPNGIVVFGALAAGARTVTATAPGYAASAPVDVTLAALETRWLDVFLVPLPVEPEPEGVETAEFVEVVEQPAEPEVVDEPDGTVAELPEAIADIPPVQDVAIDAVEEIDATPDAIAEATVEHDMSGAGTDSGGCAAGRGGVGPWLLLVLLGTLAVLGRRTSDL